MILMLSAVVAGIVCGRFLGFHLPSELVTGLLMVLVFVVGLDVGGEEKILSSIKANIPLILVQSSVTIGGTLLFAALGVLFLPLSLKEAMGVSAGFGWYSLSGVMISEMASPFLGAVSFAANIFREMIAIVCIPLLSRFSPLGSISLGGAASMDVLVGLIARHNSKKNTLVAFGQGVLVTLSVPVVISLFFRAG
ncbi:MAG TPA: lysine exporter LysO family protein [Thermotogota bacterium]|nr:lysine exporter LysO family protein [Thermotogota bacterium]HRW91943.1 lysine exporter LysO family protein [Thermotogota bacterium]